MVNTTENPVKKTLTLKVKRNKDNQSNTLDKSKVNKIQNSKIDENKVNLLEVKKIVYAQFEVLREFKPLAIKDIVEQVLSYNKDNSAISRRSLRRFLRIHVNSYKYLKNVLEGDCRYNLDGTKAEGEKGVITQQAKDYSKELVEKQEKIFAEKKAKMASQKHKKFNNKKKFNNNNNSYKKTNGYKKSNFQNKNSSTTNVVYRNNKNKRTFGTFNKNNLSLNKKDENPQSN